MFRLLTFLLIAVTPAISCADVGFKFITSNGYVTFSAQDQWAVLNMQSKLPLAAAVFQLPNPADEGASHSTNIIFKYYQLGSPEAERELQQVGKQYGSSPPNQRMFEQWTVFRQLASQGNVRYTILDAKTKFESVAASVRLAWPHLSGNDDRYDEKMEQVFIGALRSVKEHIGSFAPSENEIIRRSTQ